MALATLAAVASSAAGAGGASKNVTLACQAGDILVVRAQAEDGSLLFANPPTNDGTGLVWTSRGNVGTASVTTRCAAWTAVVDTTRTIIITVTPSGGSTALWWGIIGKAWRGSDGVGNTTALTTAGGVASAVTLNLTTTQANSVIDFGVGDFGAVDRSNTANYRTNAGAASEDQYFSNSVHYTLNDAHHADAGAIGTYAIGRNETYVWAMVIIEIKGSAAAAAVLLPRRRMTVARGRSVAGAVFR